MALLDSTAQGVFVICATPFDCQGGIDLTSADRLIEFYLERGVDGITILGMMGEAPKLTTAEAIMFAGHVIQRVAGRVPIIVGVSAPGFASMGELTASVMEKGAAGAMIAPPPTVAKGDEAVLGYFRKVTNVVGAQTPWVLQDFPLAAQVPMSAALIRRIADECLNCVMLKHEDWPGLDKLSAIRAQETAGARRLSILAGNGGIFLPHELERGADGAMTGFAYPEMLVEIIKLHRQGERNLLLDLFDAYLPLVRYEQQPSIGLAARKYVLMRRGAIASDFARAPSPALSAASRAEIDWLMTRLKTQLDRLT